MDFFASLTDRFIEVCDGLKGKSFPYDESLAWNDLGYNQVLLQRYTKYELDGVGFNLVTTSPLTDETVVFGDDLGDIKSNRKFARVTLIQVDDIAETQDTYDLLKKLDFIKYHISPEGYMMRSTSKTHKEAVRVSKEALKNGMSFEKIGDLFIKKYKENPTVKAVRVIFITDPKTAFSELEAIAVKNHEITEALNQVMNNVMFDCDNCNLKAICDEVEGLKELHFKSVKENNSL